MIESFGLLFLLGHIEDITSGDSLDTSPSVSTDSPWEGMYKKDKYARERVIKAVRLLLPYIKPKDTVLDVGCFTHEAKKYLPKSVTYIGLDQKAYHKETRVIDLNHGFDPISCSHALCLETLEHLLDPLDTLLSIHNSISEESKLVVSLPNETTLFHRMRSLFGTVDNSCFQGEGKHLHLPSLHQSRLFLSQSFEILSEQYYISPTAVGSQQAWIGRLLTLLPDVFHQFLADKLPSLFARGFIFLLKKRAPTAQKT